MFAHMLVGPHRPSLFLINHSKFLIQHYFTLAIGHLLFSLDERRTTDTSECVSSLKLAETGEGVVYARKQGVV
jgi:hypothetical protein